MGKTKNKLELFFKGYFQLWFFIFVSAIYYLIANFSFTFWIDRWDFEMYNYIYFFVIFLTIFSGTYTYLLYSAVTKNLYKKILYYINSSLLTIWVLIFIIIAFVIEDNFIQLSTLLLVPTLLFNIFSWLLIRRIQTINFSKNKNFLRNTIFSWIIIILINIFIGSLQPYNRLSYENNLTYKVEEISNWWTYLDKINKKILKDEDIQIYWRCIFSIGSDKCTSNKIFWDEISSAIKEWKNEEEKVEIVFDSLSSSGNLDKLLEIKRETNNLKKYNFVNSNELFNSNLNQTVYFVTKNYEILIKYFIYKKDYSQANEIINDYYSFLIKKNKQNNSSLYYLNNLKIYYSELKKEGYNDIIFPEKIEKTKISFLKNYYSNILNEKKEYIYVRVPDIFLLVNKNILLKYINYNLLLEKNNQYISKYKNPIFYYLWNNIYLWLFDNYYYNYENIERNFDNLIEITK